MTCQVWVYLYRYGIMEMPCADTRAFGSNSSDPIDQMSSDFDMSLRDRLGLWRKNIPALYDCFVDYSSFTSEPLSIDWMHDLDPNVDPDPSTLCSHWLVMGTQGESKQRGQVRSCFEGFPNASSNFLSRRSSSAGPVSPLPARMA